MTWFLAFILSFLWVIGLLGGHTMGGFLHILPMAAVAAIIFRIIQGRRAVTNGRQPPIRRNPNARAGVRWRQ